MTPFGFTKHARRTTKLLSFEPLPGLQALSHNLYDSTAIWADVSAETVEELSEQSLCVRGACHAAAHAILACLPLFLVCDRADIGTECPSARSSAPRPARIILFDAVKGGIGLAAAAFAVARPLVTAALNLMRSCPCENGCLRCCFDTSCTELNIVIDKAGAVQLLGAMLGGTS
jgi:DEAD/DEAH box helicase domain-containing protein